MDVRFSVIIPVYNTRKYLEKCIDSVIQQDYTNLEIILVDDGSTDGSEDICEKYAGKDPRIIVIHQENRGLSGARNTGIKKATGRYLLFVDSDDYIDKDSVSRFATVLQTIKADVVVGEARSISEVGTVPMTHRNLTFGRIYTGIEYSICAIKDRSWYAPSWLNMYSRDFLLRNDLFFTEGIFHEDLEYQARLFLSAEKTAYLCKPFYNYVSREGSITNDSRIEKKKIKDVISTLNKWMELFEHSLNDPDRRIFNGMLIKQFLYFSRLYGNTDRRAVKGINISFILKNSLDLKEMIKGILFMLFPEVYVRL